MEALLFKLFPEGPTRRERNSWRFGSNGSLVVRLIGEEKGAFYDHENQVGGGPLELIKKMLGLSNPEANEWAKEFLGESKNFQTPKFASTPHSSHSDLWISCKPSSDLPAPSLKEIGNELDRRYNEVARHPYNSEKGELLFYILRLVNKENPGQKKIFPLSFGHIQGDEGSKWSLRGYQTQKKPLYNLPKAIKETSKMILIVEGEKTADAANRLFSKDDITCVTWCGGASTVNKSDWTPLFGK